MAGQLPLDIQEHCQLQQLGISASAIGFSSLTMESDRFICVREKQSGDCIVIVDMNEEPLMPIREPIIADSAIMNPVNRIIALKAQKTLKIFDLELKCELKSHQMVEDVTFWRWINDKIVAVVTDMAVYHWSSIDDAAPLKMFDIHPNLAGSQIVNYRTDAVTKWLLLIGISATQNNRAAGAMQLYSVDRQLSQPLEGHAAVFIQYKLDKNLGSSNLLAFAARPAAAGSSNTGKLQITELGSPPSTAAGSQHHAFQKKTVDITFSPEAANDFPVALQASGKYGVLFLITKLGYVHLYEIESAQLICMARISSDPVFVTAPYTKTSGVVAVNRRGQVLSISVDENSIVPFIASQLNNIDLAVRFALRNKLVAADDLYMHRFEELFNLGKYQDAARIAARAPRGILRSPRTIQRFQAASSAQLSQQQDQPLSTATGFMTSLFAGVQKAVKQQTSMTTSSQSPLLQYFEVLLENGKLNKHESLEFGRAALSQPSKQSGLLEKWLNNDKLECSEELGDLAKQYADVKLAQMIYLRASVPSKVLQCLAETGQFQEIISYAEKVDSFKPDYIEILRHLLQTNHQGVDFAKWLVQQHFVADIEQLVDVFMEQNLVKQCTAFLLDVLQQRGDQPEDAALQTRLIEINLLSTPHVAEAILNSNKFTHYNRERIAELCRQAGLTQKYDELTRMVQPVRPPTTTDTINKRPHDSLELEDSEEVIEDAPNNSKLVDADLPSVMQSVCYLIGKMTQLAEKRQQRQNDADSSTFSLDAVDAVEIRSDFAALLDSFDQLADAQAAVENQRKVDFEQSQRQQQETASLLQSKNLKLLQRISELEDELNHHRNQARYDDERRSNIADEAEQTAKDLKVALEEKQAEIERQREVYEQQLADMRQERALGEAQKLQTTEQWRQQQSDLERQIEAKTIKADSLKSQCGELHKTVNDLQAHLAAQTSALQSVQLQSSASSRKDDEITAKQQQQQQATIARLQAECERLKLHLSEQEQSYSAEFSACEARESQLHEQLQLAARRNDELNARVAQALHERAQLSTNNSSQLSELSAALAQANEQRTQADERCVQLQTSLEQFQIALHQIQREHSQALAREREQTHRILADKDAQVSQFEAKRAECDAALQKVQQVLKAGEDREVLVKTYEQKLKMLAPLLAERDMVIDDLQSALARHTGKPYQSQHSRIWRQDSSSPSPADSLNRMKSFDAGSSESSTAHNAADLCDKSIVRDMLYKYFTSPKKYQPDMLALLCSVLGFNNQQRIDMLKGTPNSSSGESGGGWLRLPFVGGGSGGGGGAPDHSLRAEFVRYLLEQSESGGATSDVSKKVEVVNPTTLTDTFNGAPPPQGLLLTADSSNIVSNALTGDSRKPSGT